MSLNSTLKAQHKPFPIIDVLIPAYNEENSIGKVIQDIPKSVRNILVVNNNSKDNTRQVAEEAGAIVLNEPVMGYGKACLTGMSYLANLDVEPEILVFLDGDYSDYPEQMLAIIDPILKQDYDMVIGSRARGNRESGSMTLPQVFGNWLATSLMRVIYKTDYSDLGPFRAIKWDKLKDLGMVDQNYGWTIEMQIKAAKAGLKTTEVPVDYRKRIGVSKVSGTIKGVFGAAYKILWTIWRYW
ncbi:glycosyltransferase family 2 protein [Aquiflexum gelatinilyticum]|uniref:Glycosyltransferase family 2 protein n=1 Tax=Aquiflexum gelatinilyticum TaxID=2961943 RepID=A0A9X2PBF3_9BACT|nr:glycosyltransferase family 2 protein [Aquiflexum gelatinilyticum]MCR9016499.1 glycosyltransferase family 2 protein [Aquiflexum gelatinilyticum]